MADPVEEAKPTTNKKARALIIVGAVISGLIAVIVAVVRLVNMWN